MRNIIFKLTLFLVLISLVACGKGVAVNLGGSGNDHSTGQNPPVALRDQPTPKICNGAPPKNASIKGESWTLNQSAGSLTVVQSLYVEENQTTLTATCSTPKAAPVSEKVQVSSTFTSSVLKHAAAASKPVAPRLGTCSIFLDSSPSPYKLVGSCLSINLNGQNHVFVRTSRLFLDF